MQISKLTPKQSLNKAFLKQATLRKDIDLFKKNLKNLLSKIDVRETEENQKAHIRDFLLETFYKDKDTNEIKYAINTKGNIDLAIHLGKLSRDNVGVIIETKRPSNSNEMISETNPNAKALHELILYYLQERIDENNTGIKYLIATNIYEWYIFDASIFEKLFYNNSKFRKDYEEWRDKQKVTHDTSLFYNSIAKPYVDEIKSEIRCTYFNLNDYQKYIDNPNEENDKELIALYKMLSPHTLFKELFANDSNALNEPFYRELLYILGLEEVKDGNRNIIRRLEKNVQAGSLIENTINILKTDGILNRLSDKTDNRETDDEQTNDKKNEDEQLFDIALELCLTWVNRILFLKLLEGQLITYHKGNTDYRFLKRDMINDYDDLQELFFGVLAVQRNGRDPDLQKKYSNIPYLNSSLFEKTELEEKALQINQLKNRYKIHIFSATVLKNINGTKISGEIPTLEYLFKFLDAYDFSSEGADILADTQKSIINASVLGKVFEKINGYKDGSIYTPGSITQYMAKETIRQSILQKFNDKFNWNCTNFDDIYNHIKINRNTADIKDYNDTINKITICDPAVGSGHFLVSALNELIACKSDLGILADQNGKLLDIKATVDNDELNIYDKNDNLFVYNPESSSSTDIQKAIFQEKQTLIENCLFGVDINPKSVLITQLRLWIELLKNAYYKDSDRKELETLPNIDINIKCGNSLISKFRLTDKYSDFNKVTEIKIKDEIKKYKEQVFSYKVTNDKKIKQKLIKEIDHIKEIFSDLAIPSNEDQKKLKMKEAESDLLPLDSPQEEKDEYNKKAAILDKEIKELRKKIKDDYKDALEWRFEFPEVLNEDGDFVGFDIIIANPPYIRQEKIKQQKALLEKQGYKVFNSTSDIYTYFYERGFDILKPNGILCFISSNKWMRAKYGEKLRHFIKENTTVSILIDFAGHSVFDATVDTNIILFQKHSPVNNHLIKFVNMPKEFETDLANFVESNHQTIEQSKLSDNAWTLADDKVLKLKEKIESIGKPLKDWEVNIYYGIKTGFNEAFIITTEKRNEILANCQTEEERNRTEEIIKPILRGRDISKYYYKWAGLWLIKIESHWTNRNRNNKNAEQFIKETLPSLYNYLISFENVRGKGKGLLNRDDQGEYWWELRDCDYYPEFEKEKIVWAEMTDNPSFALDKKGFYTNQTVYVMTGNNLTYIVGLLNSKISYFYLTKIAYSLSTNANRWIKQYVERIPLPPITAENLQIVHELEKLVDEILIAKKENPDADTRALESQIDQLVYQLYNLTDEEIKIVEGGRTPPGPLLRIGGRTPPDPLLRRGGKRRKFHLLRRGGIENFPIL